MEFLDALWALTRLDLLLVAAFAVSVVVLFGLYHLSGRHFCQTCVAVAGLWILNLLLGFLPAWVTVFLMGQSIAGGAAMGRDHVSDRASFEDLPDRRRRLAKQFTYFGLLLGGTLGGVGLLLAAGHVPRG